VNWAKLRNDVFTDDRGRPIPKPERSEYTSDYDYVCAVHIYHRSIEAMMWKAFDEQFQKEKL